MNPEREPRISPSTYEWSVRLFTTVKRLLKVNIKLHHSEGQVQSGQIFLFNHFARFETFIPQYLIYQESGVFCRSVASAEFFAGDDAFANYLLSLGAVPNDHPRLLPFLAEEILRGSKVIVFPEGGMVKDRRVLDKRGRYSIYSPTAHERRKHHTGAAVLALALDAFKGTILDAARSGDRSRLDHWLERLELDSVEKLLEAARQPTLIVPANITFYPIRINDNLLRRGAQLIKRGLSRRLTEELLIEGNILLKDTDMDIRLGSPVDPAAFWRPWERKLFHRLARALEGPDQLLAFSRGSKRLDERMASRWLRSKSLRIRNLYMHRMYGGVTVNLSHLAARLIMALTAAETTEMARTLFDRALYLALKKVQKEPSVYLHRSLRNPDWYRGVADGTSAGLQQFLTNARNAELVALDVDTYHFLPKLRAEYGFHEVRLQNPVAVYANEVSPISAVTKAVGAALKQAAGLDAQMLARHRFDDEVRSYRWDRDYYRRARYGAINSQETATASAEPFLLLPARPKAVGVVLIHGFLASPAEVAEFGAKLEALGYPVIGVRLKGHGTSPWDLRERTWRDWLDSVRRGYAIMSAFAERICVVGFSTGAALALLLASEAPEGLVGAAAISVPLRFRNRNMIFVPLLHQANRLASWLPTFEGIVPFRLNESEHPHINYRNIPVRGLYELRLLVDQVERSMGDVRCPAVVLQATRDHVVDPKSARILMDGLGSIDKRLVEIDSDRHGILAEDIGATQDQVIAFLERLATPAVPGATEPSEALSAI